MNVLQSSLIDGLAVGSGRGTIDGCGLAFVGDGLFNARLVGGVGSRVGLLVGINTGNLVGNVDGSRTTGFVITSGKTTFSPV